jgi:hypothetical protein
MEIGGIIPFGDQSDASRAEAGFTNLRRQRMATNS